MSALLAMDTGYSKVREADNPPPPPLFFLSCLPVYSLPAESCAHANGVLTSPLACLFACWWVQDGLVDWEETEGHAGAAADGWGDDDDDDVDLHDLQQTIREQKRLERQKVRHTWHFKGGRGKQSECNTQQ